jgi:hypothetical protein
LALLWVFFTPCNGNQNGDMSVYNQAYGTKSYGSFTPAPVQNANAGSNTYNDTIQAMALESDVYSSHNQFLDSLNLTWTPLNASEKSDCIDINGRVGIMPVDYRNVINPNQNISIPDDSCAKHNLNTKNRWGGYGYGMCKGE